MSSATSADATGKRLTDYADCAGCASKFDAADLDALMGELTPSDDPRVLVDFRTADDAGVYRWDGDQAIVQTVDFFTPVVDDPYLFGRIAAANALSDVYAMGGTPRTALAIAALPKKGPSADVVRLIFRGGADVLREAGVALLGGHTVSDPEVKFGYAITGEVHADRVLTNAGARAGDALLLTKPLGTGIIVRARKYGQGEDAELEAAIASMTQLNDKAAAAAAALPPGSIGACTDVTGFGLAGHASEIALASGVTIVFDSAQLPMLPGVARLAAEFLPCGGRANLRHFKHFKVSPEVPAERHLICLDPQTSGGLLISVRETAKPGLIGYLTNRGVPFFEVGRVTAREDDGTLVRLD
ncbi:MAG: selenide, water dikinase SelD [Vicinamibacterales bacterium]